MQIVSCDRLHNSETLARAKSALREKYPGVAADIPAALDRYAFTPEIQTKLLADLAPAGMLSAR